MIVLVFELFRHQSFCFLLPLEATFAPRYSGDSAGMTQQADGSYVAKWGSQREESSDSR